MALLRFLAISFIIHLVLIGALIGKVSPARHKEPPVPVTFIEALPAVHNNTLPKVIRKSTGHEQAVRGIREKSPSEVQKPKPAAVKPPSLKDKKIETGKGPVENEIYNGQNFENLKNTLCSNVREEDKIITPAGLNNSGPVVQAGVPASDSGILSRSGFDDRGESNVSTSGPGGHGNEGTITAPVPVVKVEPDYPETEKSNGVEGKVGVIVEVGTGGEAGCVDIFSSSGIASLDRAAIEAVRKWRFLPGRNGTGPVVTRVRLWFKFQVNEL
ncbi:MAG: TonB family protein [Chloroflexi bacterium]|nr:TonB family protein [Chloroflexota bacterium]